MPSRNTIVLVVEDNSDDAELTVRALRRVSPSLEIVIAHDGVEALDALFGAGDYEGLPPIIPLFVLLDLKLPKVMGLEVLKQIRKDTRTGLLPVIVFSSSTVEMDILNSYTLGANSYISKPIDYRLFCDRLKLILEYWAICCQPPTTNR